MNENQLNKSSRHAIVRLSQRNISTKFVNILIHYTSARIHRGDLIYLGQDKHILSFIRKGLIGVQEADKLRGLVVICSFNGQLITAYFPDKKRWKIHMRCPLYKPTDTLEVAV